MRDMMTYEFEMPDPSAPHPDMAMEVYTMLGDDGDLYILHDRPFIKPLSWIEYSVNKGMLNFIMEDGDIRDFGIPVEDRFRPYLDQKPTIAVAQIENGECVDGDNFPLILHEV